MAKQFNDFTYGVGLTINATSFKQVKDDLKINLETLKKMIKSYDEMLKIDPNADLSKLQAQIKQVQSLVNGIGGSQNTFDNFVDKGVLDRVAALENGLQSITSVSQDVQASLSAVKASIAEITEPLKNAGQAKFPATFDNLFGGIQDQSAQIQSVKNLIRSLESELPKLQNLWEELGHSKPNKNWSIDDIDDWIVGIDDIKDRLSDVSKMDSSQLSGFITELETIGGKLGSALASMSQEQMKSFRIDDEYVVNEIQECINIIKEQKVKLDTELQSLNELQTKYENKLSAQTSRGKSLGVQSDYTAQVKVTPKINDTEWANKINDTIKNIEPQLSPIQLTPTFTHNSKSIQKELGTDSSQITHTVNVKLNVNVEEQQKFEERIAYIDNLIRSTKEKLAEDAKFKVSFTYEDGGRFRDVVTTLVKQLQNINVTLKLANKKSFLTAITALKKQTTERLKNIPADFKIGNTDKFMSSVDALRENLDKKIGNIGVNLNIQNLPQFTAQAALMRDGIEDYYNKNPIGAVVGPGSNGIETATNDMQELSEAAKQANSDLEKSKNILQSLTNEGFNSAHFLELGDINAKGKKVKDSTKKLEKLLREYNELKKKLPSGDVPLEDWFNIYPEAEGNVSFLGAFVSANRSRLQELEEELNSYLQKQIAYTQKRQEAAEAVLQTEKAIVNTQQESVTGPQEDVNAGGNQQLAKSAEEAAKQVKSLNGTLSWQKRILNDLNDKGIQSSYFTKLGEWDKESNSFKKNTQEIQALVQKYNELRDARIAAGGKAPGKEELSIKGKLVAILRSQKQHTQEIIAANQAELESAKQIANTYKQSGSAKSKVVQATSTQLDNLTTKLDKAKAALQQLQSGDLGAIGKTGLGDVSGRLEEVGSTQKLQQVLQLYNNLIIAKNKWINSGGKGEFKYAQQLEVVEQQLQQIHHDQLQYTQNRLAALEEEIRKEKEKIQLQDKSKSAGTQKATLSSDQATSSVVKLDGATLNSLAKDETLRTIDGKINTIIGKLGNINIDGSNISINANNVSVSGKGASAAGGIGGTKKDSGNKEVKLSTISNYSQQLTAFEERVKRTGLYTDELNKEFKRLRTQLDAMKVQDDAELYKIDLNQFKESFDKLKTYDQLYQKFVQSQSQMLQIQHKIQNSDGSTQQLSEQLKQEQEISLAIEEQLIKYTDLFDTRARQLAIEEAIAQANKANAKSDATQSDKNINKQNDDIAKIVDNAKQKLNDMQSVMQNAKVPMADAAIAKFTEYDNLLTKLKTKQQEIAANPDLLKDADYSKEFNNLLLQMEAVQKEFGVLQKSSETFLSKIKNPQDIQALGSTFDASNLTQLHSAMQEFANQAGNGVAKLIEFNDTERTATFEIQNNKGQIQQLTVEYDTATHSLGRYISKTRESTSETQKFINSIKHSFQNVARYIASFGSVYRIFAIIKQGVTYIQDIDSALTELKKVTDETDASYEQFLQNMSKTARVVGSTVADLTTMSAEWARLGYSMEEAGKLAESTAILLNVSEFSDATKASEALISTMQAFQYTANESQHVVDILNEVGNNYAISSDGIATALQDSASALMSAGNNLEQATALVAAANKVVQDPNSVGSALRTISLRLRGTSVKILEEMGEETEGVIESTSKLQAKIKALSGVDILTNAGDYKDTYTILKEIGTVWEEMSDIDQAALLELMAGKNRANTLSAILSNMEDLEGAYQSAMNAEGSALRENETYLDSIQGRIDLFNNSVQTMWMNFINSDVIKFFVNVGTGLIDLIDNIGVFQTALMGIVGYLTIIKKQDLSKLFGNLIGGKTNKIQLLDGQALQDEIDIFNTELSKGAEAFGQYKLKAKEAGNGMDILADKVEKGVIQTKNGKVTAEDYTIALQSQSEAAQKAARAEKLKSVAIGASVILISGIISAIKSYADSIKTLDERYEELQSNITTVESDVNSLSSQLESIGEQIDVLSNKNLTIAEAEELRKLKEQSAELQKQKELRESTLATYKKQNQTTSLEMFNQKLKETAAGQEKAKETAKSWAKAIGAVLDVALIAGGVAVTGLSGGLATAAGAAMMGAGMSGTATSITEAAADALGGTTKSVNDLTQWYDSYVDAIKTAEQEVAEAEATYFANMSDSNYEKWQKKLDASNTLKEDLYNNLEEMQGYINNLEYNNQTKATIDEFNKLMTHISVTSMDGDVNAQISSIEALKSEYESLSRGVDEHGNNIALSAEEYARYQAIISQVLGYNVGLTQSFDENGSAIRDAAGNLVGYNDILAETIKLLQQQQRQAAIDAIDGKNKDGAPLWDAYESAAEQAQQTKTSDYKLMPNALSSWNSNDSAKIVGEVIGEKQGLFDDPDTLIKEYTSKVAQHRDEIIAAITEGMRAEGISEEQIASYVDQYTAWLDDALGRYSDANNVLSSEFKKTLAIVPQMSNAYSNLTGSQLAFVNEYISSLELTDDMSKEQVQQIKDDIVSLVDTIGQDKTLQAAINDLIALDPSAMPVAEYRAKFTELWNTISSSVPEGQQEALLNQLFPDQSQIDTMIDAVKQELEASSRVFVEGLSLEDLRIAFKIRAEYDNDYEEYQKIVAEREKLAESIPDEERYFGNVDEYARHVIVVTDNLIEELKTKKLIPDEWTKDNVGNYMTTFGGQDFINNGELTGQSILYTPILPNGEILHKDTLDTYIDAITQNATSEADVLAADKVGMMIGEQFVSGIINGVTNVDDQLINSILDPVFSNLNGANIAEYGEQVNQIVSDQIVSALDITDSEAVNEISNMVSDTLDNAFANASPDASLTDVIDEYSMELITSASAIKMSQEQHNVQADIYDKEYEALVNLNTAGLTYEQLQQKIAEHKTKVTGPIVETYTALIEQVNKFNEVELQTSEIVLDNTKVTQEYKDSLVELGISEEELAECFDANNNLVVVNAKRLNKLVKSAKNNTSQNVKLAKSQAKLQYYELYKKMQGYINAEGKVVAGKVKEIVALYEEMNALEKTIAKYSRLEVQLLDAANAYEKFEQAQEIDAATNYIDDAASMVLALGEAFNTAELGSESAQAAIAGLVPKSVYEDLDTVDEKMAAIYEYFKKGKIAQYFALEFDDDGSITNAEMKLGNLRKFIEDGLSNNTFAGTDWQHFEFSEVFLSGLEHANDKLQFFADNMGVTKEVAFAFIEALNDHDIEWLNGDYSSLFDILTPETLEGNLYNTMQAVADLNVQLATGKITAEEYRNSMYGLQGQLNSGVITQEEYNEALDSLRQQLLDGKITAQEYNEALVGLSGQETILADQAREQANAWYEKTEKLEEYNEQLQEYYKQLETGKDADGNLINAEEVRDKVEEVSGHINELTKDLSKLEEPTQLTMQVALDDIKKDLNKAKKELESEKIDLEKAIAIDAEGKYYVTTEFAGNQKLENYVSLLNEQHTLEVNMGSETPTVLSTLESVSQTLSDIKLLLETKYNLQLDTDGAYKNVVTFKSLWDKISDKSVTLSVIKWVWEKIKRSTEDDEEGAASVNGTAHAQGTAHKSGNWGLPNSEHDSLVGELGPELVWKIAR